MKVADFWLLSGNISATSCKTAMENVFYYETTWLWFILLYEIIEIHCQILTSASLIPKTSHYIITSKQTFIRIMVCICHILSEPVDPLCPVTMSRT